MWYTGSRTFGCFPHQFQLGDTFRTNISAFSYSIFDVGSSQSSQSEAGGLPAGAGFLYANQDLTACDVDEFEIIVKPGDRLIMATVNSLKCPWQFQTAHELRRLPYYARHLLPFGLLLHGGKRNASFSRHTFSLERSYSNHAMIGSRAVSAFPLNSLARAITDGMRNIMGTFPSLAPLCGMRVDFDLPR
jgi:hypothetical protein